MGREHRPEEAKSCFNRGHFENAEQHVAPSLLGPARLRDHPRLPVTQPRPLSPSPLPAVSQPNLAASANPIPAHYQHPPPELLDDLNVDASLSVAPRLLSLDARARTSSGEWSEAHGSLWEIPASGEVFFIPKEAELEEDVHARLL
jgi:hypothetical protein